MTIKHNLMHNNFTNQDMSAVRNFLKIKISFLHNQKKFKNLKKNGQDG